MRFCTESVTFGGCGHAAFAFYEMKKGPKPPSVLIRLPVRPKAPHHNISDGFFLRAAAGAKRGENVFNNVIQVTDCQCLILLEFFAGLKHFWFLLLCGLFPFDDSIVTQCITQCNRENVNVTLRFAVVSAVRVA